MDANETIVSAWLETKGFFVRSRLKYDLSGGKWASISDIDLLGYNPKESKRVAIMVTSWMTQRVTPSHFKPTEQLGRSLNNFLSLQASQALREAFNLNPDEEIERWWIFGSISPRAKEVIDKMANPNKIQVFEFRDIMSELVSWVKKDQLWIPHELEVLQTIRALAWCDLFKPD